MRVAGRAKLVFCLRRLDRLREVERPEEQAVLAGDVTLQIPSHRLVTFEPTSLLRDQAFGRNQVLRLDLGSDHVLVERQRQFAGDAVVVVEQDSRRGLELEQARCPLACGARDAIAVCRVRGKRLGGLNERLTRERPQEPRSAPAEAR